MPRKYERVYCELEFDKFYRSVPGLRDAIRSVEGFVTWNDPQVQALEE